MGMGDVRAKIGSLPLERNRRRYGIIRFSENPRVFVSTAAGYRSRERVTTPPFLPLFGSAGGYAPAVQVNLLKWLQFPTMRALPPSPSIHMFPTGVDKKRHFAAYLVLIFIDLHRRCSVEWSRWWLNNEQLRAD